MKKIITVLSLVICLLAGNMTAAFAASLKNPDIYSLKNASNGQKLEWSSDYTQNYTLFFGTKDIKTDKVRWRRSRDVYDTSFNINPTSLKSSGWKKYGVDQNKSTPKLESGTRYCYQVYSKSLKKYSKVVSLTYLEVPKYYTSKVINNNSTKHMAVTYSTVPNVTRYEIAYKIKGSSKYNYLSWETFSGSSYVQLGIKDIKSNSTYHIQARSVYQTTNKGTAYGAWSTTVYVNT